MTRGIAELERAVTLSNNSVLSLGDLATGCALAGKRERALKILKEIEEYSKEHYVSPVSFAEIHAALGETDGAMNWLEKGYREHATGIGHLVDNPVFDEVLGSDKRYIELKRKAGYPSA